METISSVLKLVRPNMFFASVDLKDAYYTINVDPNFRKFLKFSWNSKIYIYTVAPNGLACVPRKFTKLVKPVLAKLREQSHIITSYLDDFLLAGENYIECKNGVAATVALLQHLWFGINFKKSELIPKQTITFLGFVINSLDMTIKNNETQSSRIQAECTDLLNSKRPCMH